MGKTLQQWLVPLLAMLVVLAVSSARVYFYLDGMLNAYAQSFHETTTDYYVYWTFHTRELQQLIDSLEEKKVDLDKREENLTGWQTQLENQKKEIEDSRTQLEALKTSISSLVVQSKPEELKNLKSLSSTYAAMTPEAVVGILNEMDDTTVVKILALMKSDTVGPIFEAMARIPNQEEQMRAKIARLSEKLRLYKQAQAPQ